MATHSGHAFLNSCLKTPIDPCNNCPAPIYNRPKMYLGRKSQRAKLRPTTTTVDANDDDVNESDGTWSNTGIRSLAKFYDSIPDYCEVNQMPEAEFYSTIESLRTTSRELRTQSTLLDPCASNSTTSLSTYCGLDKVKSTKKKRQGSAKGTNKRKINPKKPSPPTPEAPPLLPPAACSKSSTHCVADTLISISDDYTKCLRGLSKLTNFKEEFAAEVADFKRTLKSYEQEFKRPTSGRSTVRNKSGFNMSKAEKKLSEHACISEQKQDVHAEEKPPACLPQAHKAKIEKLRKSYSVNDLDALPEDATQAKAQPLLHTNVHQTEISKYFLPKRATSSDLPKIMVDSPATASSKRSSSASSRLRRGKTKAKKCAPTMEKPPFTLLELTSPNLGTTTLTPSPVYPVSRPNLAATLRAEVARRKVKELKNNCTYQDTTPAFDWEVRKTPAWKSLAMNEPHKAILSIRLATRKAEQALQQRQYELNMELMRQRVKSAPLLLEGETYWGPNVGKLTHVCQHEGIRHTCESKQRKQRKKSASQSSRCATATNNHLNGADDWHANAQNRESAKVQQLRKIYGSNKCSSRNSQRSTSGKHTQRSRRSAADAPPCQLEAHDSADDLCSVDRAFL